MVYKKVYLDNSATTKVAPEAAKEMQKAMSVIYGNPSSIHLFGDAAKALMENARESIAKEINAEPYEIIFTSGGTEADNLAIKGIVEASGKKHIITSKIEHPAVLESCKALEKKGCKITYIPVNRDGLVDPQKIEEAITDDTAIVTIMHANNEIGTIQPIEEIGKICSKFNVPFHTDTVQSFTKIPIDVKKMNLSAASLSAHKIHGPKGIGALYLRKGVKIAKQMHGGHHEYDKRAGTENVPGIVGFSAAATLPKKTEKIQKLRDYLIKELLKIPDAHLNGLKSNRLCNNVNVRFYGIEGESLLMHLSLAGIAVSTGSACSSQSLEPSHVLLALGLKHEEAHGSIRITLSRYTTKAEIDYALKHIRNAVAKLRKISPLVNSRLSRKK